MRPPKSSTSANSVCFYACCVVLRQGKRKSSSRVWMHSTSRGNSLRPRPNEGKLVEVLPISTHLQPRAPAPMSQCSDIETRQYLTTSAQRLTLNGEKLLPGARFRPSPLKIGPLHAHFLRWPSYPHRPPAVTPKAIPRNPAWVPFLAQDLQKPTSDPAQPRPILGKCAVRVGSSKSARMNAAPH